MERLFFPVLSLASHWFRPRYNAQLQFIEAQIRILRSRVDASRIVPTPKEKAELLRLGALLDHDGAEMMHVVRPDTYRKRVWHLGIPVPLACVALSRRRASETVSDYQDIAAAVEVRLRILVKCQAAVVITAIGWCSLRFRTRRLLDLFLQPSFILDIELPTHRVG